MKFSDYVDLSPKSSESISIVESAKRSNAEGASIGLAIMERVAKKPKEEEVSIPSAGAIPIPN